MKRAGQLFASVSAAIREGAKQAEKEACKQADSVAQLRMQQRVQSQQFASTSQPLERGISTRRLSVPCLASRGSTWQSCSLQGRGRQWHSFAKGQRPPAVASEVATTLRWWRHYANYLLMFETPSLPAWVRTRLYEIPTGWSNLIAWMPREWALRPAFHYRVAITNALYIIGGHGQRLVPVIIVEAIRKNNFAHSLAGPGHVLVGPGSEEDWQPTSWMGRLWWHLLEILEDVYRFLRLIILFTPLLLTAPFRTKKKGEPRKRWLRRLRRTLERAGPAFIKWGQWAATRKDIFPPDFCQELEHLHAKAPVHLFRFTEAAVERAFGLPLTELFDTFERMPIASGSIGQVYRARLSTKGAAHTGIDPGTLVAVKVRHPGVGYAIHRDFALMMRAARLASHLPATKGICMEETLKQFAGPLREQVDLTLEAKNLWEFNFNFRFNQDVRFPFPIYPLVAPEVLVETFEQGDGISEYVERGPGALFNSRLAELGSQILLQMMLVDNLIHFDLHPGNILVALDPPQPVLSFIARCMERFKLPRVAGPPTSWLQPRIVLLDTGMASHLSEEDQESMLALFTAFANGNGAEIARTTLRFSGKDQTCPDQAAFIADISKRFHEIEEENARNKENNGSEALGSLLETVRQHQVSLPGHICAVVVTTLVLEGWSGRLDPTHSVIEQVQRLVANRQCYAQRLGTAVEDCMTNHFTLQMAA